MLYCIFIRENGLLPEKRAVWKESREPPPDRQTVLPNNATRPPEWQDVPSQSTPLIGCPSAMTPPPIGWNVPDTREPNHVPFPEVYALPPPPNDNTFTKSPGDFPRNPGVLTPTPLSYSTPYPAAEASYPRDIHEPSPKHDHQLPPPPDYYNLADSHPDTPPRSPPLRRRGGGSKSLPNSPVKYKPIPFWRRHSPPSINQNYLDAENLKRASSHSNMRSVESSPAARKTRKHDGNTYVSVKSGSLLEKETCL